MEPRIGQVWRKKSSGFRWKVVDIKGPDIYYSVDEKTYGQWSMGKKRRLQLHDFLRHMEPVTPLELFLEGWDED